MATKNFTAEDAKKAFELTTGSKKYEATFIPKAIPVEVEFELLQKAIATVEESKNFAFENLNAEYALGTIEQSHERVTAKLNDNKYWWKEERQIITVFTADNKSDAEKLARVYAKNFLDNYEMRWVYVARKVGA